MKRAVSFVVALVCAVAFVAPAFAAATPYASVRMETFYVDNNDPDSKELRFGLQGNTRLGVNFSVSDEVSGKVELGTGGGAVGLRLAYGVYDFGPGTLTIGQDYAPFDLGTGAVAFADNGLYGYGSLGVPRLPQVTVRMDSGLYASLLQNAFSGSIFSTGVDLPYVAVGYDGSFGDANVGFGALAGDFDLTAVHATMFGLYAHGDMSFGAVGVAGKLYYGQNIGLIGAAGATAASLPNGSEDADTFAGFIALNGSINDKVSWETGVGYATSDNGNGSDPQINYYVDVPVKIAQGFTVVPSVTVFDNLDDANDNDETESLWVGAKWQFDL